MTASSTDVGAAAGTPTTPAQRRAEALRSAADNKRRTAVARAEAAIRRLARDRQEVNFRSVARAGAVSIDFLYANTDLRARIETLRAQTAPQRTTSPAAREPSETDSNLIHLLTTKLRQERAARHKTVTDLQERLAAAHGEILRLRRALQEHGIQP